eukprot:3957727-Amphidinium_carterae.1
MRKRCGNRLPEFKSEEKELLHHSSDFFGLNHYSTDYVCAKFSSAFEDEEKCDNYFEDQDTDQFKDLSWEKTDMGWTIVPWGLRRICEYIHSTYQPSGGILITENGCAVAEETREEARNDMARW